MSGTQERTGETTAGMLCVTVADPESCEHYWDETDEAGYRALGDYLNCGAARFCGRCERLEVRDSAGQWVEPETPVTVEIWPEGRH